MSDQLGQLNYFWWLIIKSQPIPNIMLQYSLHKEFYLGSPMAPSSVKIEAKREKKGGK